MVGTAVPMSPIRAMNRIVHRTVMASSPGRFLPAKSGPDWTLDRATLSNWLGRCYRACGDGRSALLRPVGLILPYRRDALDLAQRVERAGADTAVDDHEAGVTLDAVEARRYQRPHDLIQPSSLRRVDAD